MFPGKIALGMALALGAALSLKAQTAITGTVTDAKSGGMLAGVRVSLGGLGTSTQTGADGKFTLAIANAVRGGSPVRDGVPALVGSTLSFRVGSSQDNVRIDAFDLAGAKEGTLINTALPAGSYSVSGLGANLAAGTHVLRMSIGSRAAAFALSVAAAGTAQSLRLDGTSEAPVLLAKVSVVVDSLVAEKNGYARKAIPLSQYSGEYPIALDTSSAASFGDVVGKVTVGYQGWFSTSGDGSPLNNFGHTNLEMWPDVRDLTKTYSFRGSLGNGQPAKMFSAWDQSTVNAHFLWMQQNGIDCAAVQRFGSELGNGSLKAWRDGTATRVMNASQAYGRKFYIMYDISGWSSFQSAIKTDWTNVIKGSLKLTDSPAYARQNGKPVVCVWGIGFGDRPGNVASWTDVIKWFRDNGCYVIGGTPGDWRNDAKNAECYNACNMIIPWPVGRVATLPGFQSWYAGDLTRCKAQGMDYQAAGYPGTAFFNTNGSRKNLIPRNHGDFMWSQFAGMRNAGVKSVYIAMFDELNEATSIFKVAEDASMVPTGGYYLTLDADGVHVSSDFYLRLVNNGGRMVKGLIPYQAAHSTPFMP